MGGYLPVKKFGDVLQNGSAVCKKSLKMGPIFHEKIPNYGSDFLNFPGFAKVLTIWCLFVAKLQEKFCQKNP